MDDLRLVRELARPDRLPQPHELTAARAQLMAAIADKGHARSHRRRVPRPVKWAGWLGGAVAAAAVVTVLVVPRQAPPPPLLVDGVAAQVLTNAAAGALKVPDGPPPRPDQFLYMRSGDGSVTTFESWRSVDGTRDGLEKWNSGQGVLAGCLNGRKAMTGPANNVVPGQTQPCTPDPAYLADLPTDADGMLAYLYRTNSGVKGDINGLAKHIMDVVDHYLPPAARAALFEAVAKVPGLHVQRGIADGAGRPAVGVMWTYQGTMARGSRAIDREYGLLFDPNTYAYVGLWAGGRAGAILQAAFVDRPGQRP
jgi:hypothetical protein